MIKQRTLHTRETSDGMMSSELSATRLTLKKMGKVRKHEDARDESVLESLVEHRVARVIDAGLGAVGLLGKLFGASLVGARLPAHAAVA